ncbi:MAG: nucleoside phosphorylase [Spirochaetales bacterium]
MLPFFREEELLKPTDLVRTDEEMPFSMIVTWQTKLLKAIDRKYNCKQISTFRCGLPCPVYEIKVKKERVGVVNLPIGAPVSAGFMEEYIVRGVMRFVFIGSAGSLSASNGSNLIVPTQAFRDEGTSWHYAPHDSQWIEIPSSKKLDSILNELEVPHILGRVWSTDAFYRETPSAAKMMKEQKCLCVDMECAANMAVAQYRNVQCFQMFFCADKLEKDLWEIGRLRNMGKDAYEKYAEIAVSVALS